MIALAAVLAILNIALLVAHERDRAAWRRERSELLNRIKPETAQPLDQQPPPVPVEERTHDLDDDYWMAHGVEVKQ